MPFSEPAFVSDAGNALAPNLLFCPKFVRCMELVWNIYKNLSEIQIEKFWKTAPSGFL